MKQFILHVYNYIFNMMDVWNVLVIRRQMQKKKKQLKKHHLHVYFCPLSHKCQWAQARSLTFSCDFLLLMQQLCSNRFSISITASVRESNSFLKILWNLFLHFGYVVDKNLSDLRFLVFFMLADGLFPRSTSQTIGSRFFNSWSIDRYSASPEYCNNL